jgi:DNA-binding response OmpR family regulator
MPDAPVIVEFGRFRVVPHRRELLADGRPIKLGGRDFDALMALIGATGAVICESAPNRDPAPAWVTTLIRCRRIQ